jgi:hypothetical protein
MRNLALIALILCSAIAQAQYTSRWKGAQVDSGITSIRDAVYKTYNVRTYGAVGDGSHDVADAAAFSAAISAAAAAGGGIVYVPAGDYYSGNPGFSGSNITIQGAGPMDYSLLGGFLSGGTRIRGNWNVFGKNFRAKDCTFYNNGEVLILYDAAENFVLENCIFVNLYSAGPYHNVLVNDCAGVILNCRSYKGYHGFAIRASNVQVLGCSAFENSAEGIIVKAASGQVVHDVLISNFRAEASNTDSMAIGIMVQVTSDAGSSINNVVVDNFTARRMQVGFRAQAESPTTVLRGLLVTNGVTDSTRFWGTYLRRVTNSTIQSVISRRVTSASFAVFQADTCTNLTLSGCTADTSNSGYGFYSSLGTNVSLVDFNAIGCAAYDYSSFTHAKTSNTFYSSPTFNQNIGVGGYIGLTGNLYHAANFAVLNKAGSGYLNWAVRDVSGSDAQVYLSNIVFSGNIPIGGYLALTGMLYHSSNFAVLNKASSGYNTWATRNTVGADAVMDLSNIGTIASGGATLDSTITSVSGHLTRGLKVDGRVTIGGAGVYDSTLSAVGGQFTGGLRVDGSITGSQYNSGSSSFTTTATRKAIYIAGATSSDCYVVTPKSSDGLVLPVPGDLLSVYAKTDSLIVTRAAGTTSGLGFNYIRIK